MRWYRTIGWLTVRHSLNMKTSDSARARRHYLEHFGSINSKVSISNHTFLLLDAPSLVEEDYQRAEIFKDYHDWTPKRDGTVEFVAAFNESRTETGE